MAHFGTRSNAHLNTVDPRLQSICDEVIQYYDFTVICGHRDEAAQTEAHATGASKKQWPHSNHNALPSKALDVAPWPIDWQDARAFSFLAGLLSAAAERAGFSLRWGSDWDGDGGTREHSFQDTGHLEIKE